MNGRVVIPWRDIGVTERQRSWALVKQRWIQICGTLQELFGYDLEIVEADAGGEVFSRGASINRAAADLKSEELLIIADADVWVVMDQVAKAIQMARAFPGMVQPFNKYIPLDKKHSVQVWELGHVPPAFADQPVANWICVSGCCVMTKESFDRAFGFDERFIGWGYEDSAFDLMMATKVALRRSVAGPAYHLTHPGVIEDWRTDPQHLENLALWRQYQRLYPYLK